MQTKVFRASSMQEAFANMQAELGEKANNANVNIKTINGSVELFVMFDDDSSTTNSNLLEEANTSEQTPQESTIELSDIEALLKEYSEQKFDISEILFSLRALKEFDLNKCKEKIDNAIQILDSLDSYVIVHSKIKKMSNIINLITLMKNISIKPPQLTAYMKDNVIKEIDRKQQLDNTIISLNADIYSLINHLSKENFEYSHTKNGIKIEKYIESSISIVSLPFIIDDMPVTSIGDHAFIGNNALIGCASLIGIRIPDSVISIGIYAFDNCICLTDIRIPNSVISIGKAAFSDCRSLTDIRIPDSVTSIGSGAFNCCESLTSVRIPDSVTSIGSGAFSNCKSLTNINIPDSVTSIGEDAFCYCTSLTNIHIPDSVTSIGDYAFKCCESLKTISIPKNLFWSFVGLPSTTQVIRR